MESYQLVLSPSNVFSELSDATDVTYNVNWESIIPSRLKKRKFRVSFSFSSVAVASVDYAPLLLVTDLYGMTSYDPSGANNGVLGIVPFTQFNVVTDPVTFVDTTYTQWSCGVGHNSPVTVLYPENTPSMRVELRDVSSYKSGLAKIDVTDYILVLNFTVI
jgi:hypothetical protein